MDKSKVDVSAERWLNDPRNTTYTNLRGKVFRSWPTSAHMVMLLDIQTDYAHNITNAELTLLIAKGELTEIDPFKSSSIVLPIGTRTPKPTTPAKESTLKGLYAKPPSTLAGKYAKKPAASPAPTEDTPAPTPVASDLRGKYARKSE